MGVKITNRISFHEFLQIASDAHRDIINQKIKSKKNLSFLILAELVSELPLDKLSKLILDNLGLPTLQIFLKAIDGRKNMKTGDKVWVLKHLWKAPLQIIKLPVSKQKTETVKKKKKKIRPPSKKHKTKKKLKKKKISVGNILKGVKGPKESSSRPLTGGKRISTPMQF